MKSESYNDMYEAEFTHIFFATYNAHKTFS